MVLLQPKLQRVRIAKALVAAFLLKAGKRSPTFEEIGVGALQVPQRLLKRMHRGVGQPRRFFAVAPGCEFFAERGVAQLLLALLVALLLKRQRPVVDKPAASSEAAQIPLLFPVGAQLEAEGLKLEHGLHYTLVCVGIKGCSPRKTLRLQDARAFGLRGKIPAQGA